MSLELTRMRLESANMRVEKYIDENIIDWVNEEIVEPTQKLGWQEGLSENAISAISAEKTDFMKCSLVWDLQGPNGEPLAVWLENGTSPHIIEAKGQLFGGAEKLRWYDKGGSPVFRKRVKHPGTRGKKIMSRGFADNKRNLVNRVKFETNKFLEISKITHEAEK